MRHCVLLLFVVPSIVFTSCKTYEVTRFKANELDKAGDISKYNVYIQSPKNTFEVKKPSVTKIGIAGELALVKDKAEREEIKKPETPDQLKKHRHDMNLYTKTEIADSTQAMTLKKSDITEYSIVVAHSKVNWSGIGEGIADGLGIAFSLALIGGVVYWMTLNPW